MPIDSPPHDPAEQGRSIEPVGRRPLPMITSRLLLPLLGLALSSSTLASVGSGGRLAASSQVFWVQDDGTVLASGEAGRLRGDLSPRDRQHFERIEALENIRAVAVADYGDSAAALTHDGRVWLWGDEWCDFVWPGECEDLRGGSGEGYEKTSKEFIPGPYQGLENIEQIAVSGSHLVALRGDGRVLTVGGKDWGSNRYGQLGTGDLESKREPHLLAQINDAVGIAANDDVTLILRSDGTVWGMGSGRSGLLGPSANQPTSAFDYPQDEDIANPVPLRVEGLKSIRAIALGSFAAIALDDSGQVWGWGINESAQIGPSASDLNVQKPTKIRGVDQIKAIAAGYDFTLALRTDGTVLALGGNVYGALGDRRGELEGAPRVIADLDQVEEIYAGHTNGFARRADGSFLGWGQNDFAPQAERNSLPPTVLSATERPAPPSAVIAQGGVVVRLVADLDYDQSRVQFEFEINGETVGSVDLNRQNSEGEFVFELPQGLHTYRMRGTARTESGRRQVRGEGVILVTERPMQEELNESLRAEGVSAAVSALLERLRAPMPSLFRGWEFATAPALSEEDLSDLERSLGFALPPGYRQVLARSGPFSLGQRSSAWPLLAVHVPQESRTLFSWARDGLALDRDKDTNDPQRDSAASSFWYYRDELRPDGRLRPSWKQRYVAAVDELAPFLLASDLDRCGRSTVAVQWPDDLFASYQEEEYGPEILFDWNDQATCEPVFESRLHDALQDHLYELLTSEGAIFLSPDENGEENWLGTVSNEEKGKVLSLQLRGDTWWD